VAIRLVAALPGWHRSASVNLLSCVIRRPVNRQGLRVGPRASEWPRLAQIEADAIARALEHCRGHLPLVVTGMLDATLCRGRQCAGIDARG